MASEIRLPDIGDFKNVPIIEINVKPGQQVAKEDVLMTLESDKATLEVPSPADGVIEELKVKIGDRVSQGDLLATFAGEAPSTTGPGSEGVDVTPATELRATPCRSPASEAPLPWRPSGPV